MKGPRFGAERRDDARVEHNEAGAEALPRENVSLDAVEPEEPREITEITVDGSEREEFAAFCPIEEFKPDWGDVAQASAEPEQFIPDPSQLPLDWAPCVELGQRLCSHLNLDGVLKQISRTSSPSWLPEDPFIRFYTT